MEIKKKGYNNTLSMIFIFLPMLLNAWPIRRRDGLILWILQNVNLHSFKMFWLSFTRSLSFCLYLISSQVWKSIPSSTRSASELFPIKGAILSMCSSVGIKSHFSGSWSNANNNNLWGDWFDYFFCTLTRWTIIKLCYIHFPRIEYEKVIFWPTTNYQSIVLTFPMLTLIISNKINYYLRQNVYMFK